MQKVKELTWIEREKTKNEVLKDNPANCNCIEKINSLIDKKLYNTYKDKYKELTDKSKKTGISDNSIKHWKDEEIVEKMKTLSEWKDIDWFKSYESNNENKRNYSYSHNESNIRRELMKPLVSNGTAIFKEEEKIIQNLVDEYKKKRKKEIMKQKSNTIKNNISCINSNTNIKISKYPLDKSSFELQQNHLNQYQPNYISQTDSNIIDDYDVLQLNFKRSNKYFLEAFKNVTIQQIQNKKKKNNPYLQHYYMHYGTYVYFLFIF